METDNYVFAIATDDEKLDDEQRAYVKENYSFTDEALDELVLGSLFRMSDYFRYYLFDADEVAWSESAGDYYHLGSFGPIRRPEIAEVVAVVDENSECESI